MAEAVRYKFTQRFAVSAQEAFEWCTDYSLEDHALMGDTGAKRQIHRITEGILILKDTFFCKSGTVKKEKLVQLYPENYFWVSTHLSGPNRYSQFLYTITPEGKDACLLTFVGLHLDYEGKEDADALAERLCREDGGVWKLLAERMAEELNGT